MVRAFEEMYNKKYPPITSDQLSKSVEVEDIEELPLKDQLYKEILKWESNFTREQMNRIPINQDSEDMILGMVTLEDIHRFIFNVWGEIFADSPIKDELIKKKKHDLETSSINTI